MALVLDNMLAIATYSVISDKVSRKNVPRQVLEKSQKVVFHGASMVPLFQMGLRKRGEMIIGQSAVRKTFLISPLT